jgi:SPP1 family predicted phage head-tail adaptor
MMKSNVVDLISVDPRVTGVGTEPAETKRTVYCTVKSIGMQEAYQAMGVGLNPELKVILAHDFEYGGEDLCELNGQKFRIIRSYITETDGIELTLQRVAGNALPVPPAPETTVSTAEGVG